MGSSKGKKKDKRFFTPIKNNLYLTIYLAGNYILLVFLTLSFFDSFLLIPAYDPDSFYYFFFSLFIIFASYLFACFFTVTLPQFWRPTLLKVFLAVLFELVFHGLFVITNAVENLAYFFSNMLDPMVNSSSNSPAINPCPAGTQFVSLCAVHDSFYILPVFVVSFLLIMIIAYILSCFLLFIIKHPRKNK